MFANQATTALDSAAQFEEMQFLADHDPLTRLFNRRAFNTALPAEAARYHRYDHSYALIVCATSTASSRSTTTPATCPATRRSGVRHRRSPTAAVRRSTGCFGSAATSSRCCSPRSRRTEAQAVIDRIQSDAPQRRPASAGLVATFGVAVCPATDRRRRLVRSRRRGHVRRQGRHPLELDGSGLPVLV